MNRTILRLGAIAIATPCRLGTGPFGAVPLRTFVEPMLISQPFVATDGPGPQLTRGFDRDLEQVSRPARPAITTGSSEPFRAIANERALRAGASAESVEHTVSARVGAGWFVGSKPDSQRHKRFA